MMLKDLLMKQDLIYHVLRDMIQQKCLIIKYILLIMNMECHILNLKIGLVENITVVMDIYLGANKVSIYYDNETALNVSLNVFCTRWSDFCYPSDLNLIIASSVMIVYYEDILYGPYEI